MKNILTKIYIHPLTYIVILISFFTGLFKPLFTILFIIIFHELGHIIGSLIFKWKINKIMIMPFGGIVIFDELINKPLYQEFIILIMGPLFQIITFFIFKDINSYFNNYCIALLLFNLLPIYPLDGYKLWVIIFSLFYPYKLVLKITLFISLIFILFLIKKNLILIFIIFFLLKGIFKLYKDIEYIYNKFLLERCIYNFNFKRKCVINNINNMYKDRYHFINNNNLIDEKTYLKIHYNLTK